MSNHFAMVVLIYQLYIGNIMPYRDSKSSSSHTCPDYCNARSLALLPNLERNARGFLAPKWSGGSPAPKFGNRSSSPGTTLPRRRPHLKGLASIHRLARAASSARRRASAVLLHNSHYQTRPYWHVCAKESEGSMYVRKAF